MGIWNNLTNGKEVMNEVARKTNLLIELGDSEKELLKQNLIQMLTDLQCICEKHQIIFFLGYGSALGAVRHQGFIPWDDDLDIIMPREDYRRFCKIFKRELGKKYILNAPNYSNNAKARFAKMLKKGTHFREILDLKEVEFQAIFLDIFILDNIPDNIFWKRVKGIFCNITEFIAGQVFFYENCDEVVKEYYSIAGKSNYYVRIIVGFLFSFQRASHWFNLVDKIVRHKNNNSKYCGVLTGRNHYFGECFERNKIFPASYGTFEGLKVPLIHDTDSWLTKLYGNYMLVPPPEKRERHFIREITLK